MLLSIFNLTLRPILHLLAKWLFKLQVRGFENYHRSAKKTLIVCNHLSYLDGILLSLSLPADTAVAVYTHTQNAWYFRAITSLIPKFLISPERPFAIKNLIKEINQRNGRMLIFPEGQRSQTGTLMYAYPGTAMAALKTGADILPATIEGTQYSVLSWMAGKFPLKWFPKVTITFHPPRKLHIPDNIQGRARRERSQYLLAELMLESAFQAKNYHKTIFQSFLEQKRLNPRGHLIAQDINLQPVTYKAFLLRTFILGAKMAEHTKPKENVGLMLPNSITTACALMALQIHSRIPVMLNFSTGTRALISACQTSQIETIYTSERFVKAARLEKLIQEVSATGIRVVLLEKLAEQLSTWEKYKGWRATNNAEGHYQKLRREYPQTPEDTAAILFTSGSEGAPKGVALSHRNIQSNCAQVASVVDFTPLNDKVFSALPMFHSFGLTAGTILPLISGVPVFFYPSPLHYRTLPATAYFYGDATIMFGTNTFLDGYARFAHPQSFYKMRYLFAGAERVKEETRKTWADKYGIRILEGYGATETSPVISLNTPTHPKPGSVGRLLPGMSYRLKTIEGIEQGGSLTVKGPNVMQGYLLADNPGVLATPENNEHDTGDIVTVDEERYIFIQGRLKRFAKISGEMISLNTIETYIAELWPEHVHAIVSIADSRKGEALVLCTTQPDAELKALRSYATDQGISPLFVPRKIHILDTIPVLATGKTNYGELDQLLLQKQS